MAINDKHDKITNEYFKGDKGAEMKAHRETQQDFAVLFICLAETLKEHDNDPSIKLHQTFMNKINGFTGYLTTGINNSMDVLKGIKTCLDKPACELDDVEKFRDRFNSAYPKLKDDNNDGIWVPEDVEEPEGEIGVDGTDGVLSDK